MTTMNDRAKDIAYCLRPTTLVAVIVDLEESFPGDARRAMLNAAVRELVNNVGEEDARTMLAEKGLALVATFTVHPA